MLETGDKLAGQPIETLVNRGLATESRILKAPLAVAAGGWGQLFLEIMPPVHPPEATGTRRAKPASDMACRIVPGGG